MAYEYVMRTHRRQFVVDQRVKHIRMGEGSVKPETSQINMIMVQIDGIPFSVPCEPWDLEFKEKDSGNGR